MARTVQTPIACPACAASLIERSACRLCGGAGLVSKAAAARWQKDREHRLTGQYVRFESMLRHYIEELGTRRNLTAELIGEEGRKLLERVENASKMPHGHPERNRVLHALLDYVQRAETFLGGNR